MADLQPPPVDVPQEGQDGLFATVWQRFFISLRAVATLWQVQPFVIYKATANLTGAQNLGLLVTGLLQATVAGAVATISSTLSPILTGLSVDSPTLVVDATNHRVGVGTATPIDKLDVIGAIHSSGASAAGRASEIILNYAAGIGGLISIGPDAATNGSFIIETYHSDLTNHLQPLFIDPMGNLGLGTTSPTWPLTVSTTFTQVGSLVLGANDFTMIGATGNHPASSGLGMAVAYLVNITSGTQTALAQAVVFDAGGAGAVTKQAGMLIRPLAKGVHNTYLVLGTDTIPTADYAIYSVTTSPSYLAGNLGVGAITPTIYKLQVDTGTSGASHDDIAIGGIGGWASGEEHTISAAYSSTVSANKIGSIIFHYDSTNQGAIRFGNIYNSGNSSSVSMTILGNGNVGIGSTAPTASLSVAEKFQVSAAGLIPKYNNIATVAGGVPAEYAQIDTTGLTANVGATTLYTVPSTGEGFYRVNAYVVETTAGSLSSVLPNVQVIYTDKDSNTSVTLDVTPILGVAGTGQSGALGANAIGTVASGVVPIYVKASTTIQYQTVNYASNLAGMTYALRLRLELL